MAGAYEANEAGLAAEEVSKEIPAPAQAPPPPPQPRTILESPLISCMTQLMDASGQTYQPFNRTLVGSSRLSFQRRVRPRTGNASTFATPNIDPQPDP
nr:hypothetical protein [Tanacetum cinerariifolium]